MTNEINIVKDGDEFPWKQGLYLYKDLDSIYCAYYITNERIFNSSQQKWFEKRKDAIEWLKANAYRLLPCKNKKKENC